VRDDGGPASQLAAAATQQRRFPKRPVCRHRNACALSLLLGERVLHVAASFVCYRRRKL